MTTKHKPYNPSVFVSKLKVGDTLTLGRICEDTGEFTPRNYNIRQYVVTHVTEQKVVAIAGEWDVVLNPKTGRSFKASGYNVAGPWSDEAAQKMQEQLDRDAANDELNNWWGSLTFDEKRKVREPFTVNVMNNADAEIKVTQSEERIIQIVVNRAVKKVTSEYGLSTGK